jgi:tetratricopeptide (TPR) repeat protein
MERRQPNWRRALAASVVFGVAGLPAIAQEQPASNGSRFKVLVPTLEKLDGKSGIGKDIAVEVRKLIDQMPRHESVGKKEMEEAMKKYGLKEESLGCIPARQLGVTIQSELVMCGAAAGGNGNIQVDSIQFVSTKTQEAFRVQAVTGTTAKDVAQKIFVQFETYIKTLESLVFCYDYLSSQNWQGALDNCNAALVINPNSARGLAGKAFALMSMAGPGPDADKAKLTEALALYRKVLEVNAVEQDAMRTAGVIAARLGLNEESRNYFKQYLELNPGDIAVRLSIASEQDKAGDPEGALRVVEEGLKTDSANVDLITWAGVFAAKAAFKIPRADNKPTPQAKALFETSYNYYKKLYDLKQGDIEPSLKQQMLLELVQLERFPEAIDLGRRLAADPKTTASVLQQYASALQQSGNTAEAINVMDQLIAKNDTSVKGVRKAKADILIRSGNLDAAKAAFKDAVAAGEISGDEASTYFFSIGYTEKFQNKQYDAFLEYLRAARELAQGDVEKSKLHYFEGVTLITTDRPKEAPTTAAAARTLKPKMVRALELMELGAAYARSQGGNMENQYQSTVKNQRDYIAYLDQVIKAGR